MALILIICQTCFRSLGSFEVFSVLRYCIEGWIPLHFTFFSFCFSPYSPIFLLEWILATMRRTFWAAVCLNLKILPSIVQWSFQMCAASRLRTIACRRGPHDHATSVMPWTWNWITTPLTWQTSTRMKSPPGGRASPCSMEFNILIQSTSRCILVRHPVWALILIKQREKMSVSAH